MYYVAKEFSFSASHQLTHLPPDHQCARLHGHNYKVLIELRSPTLDEKGFVRDYGDLKVVKDWIDNTFDHRHLNDVLHTNGIATTAENLARLIYNQFKMQFPELFRVTIQETEKTSATYVED